MVFLKPPNPKNFPSKKMDKKVDVEFFKNALNNFDAFCDGFERAASDSFLSRDTSTTLDEYTAKYRRVTPEVVREVTEPGAEDLGTGTPNADVQAPWSEGAREDN